MARGARLPGDAWTPRDWALQQAVEMLDRSRCSGCGQPTWLSHDKANRKAFKVSAERCYGCSAIADHPLQQAKPDSVHNPQAIRYGATFVGRV